MPVTKAEDAVLRSLHPDCPDWEKLGPTTRDSAIRAAAMGQQVAAEERESRWASGFNRRTFLKGGLGVGVAALGAQLVTSRVSYAAADVPSTGTLVVIFLRGGMDGLSVLVPRNDANFTRLRPNVGVRASTLIDLNGDSRFGLHPALAPLKPLIAKRMVAAIPAVSTPDLSRSHFQAQDCLERGSTNSLTSGWLDRVLEASGAGTTFRSVAVGGMTPRSLMGTSGSIAMSNLDSIALNGVDDVDATADALRSLYTGIDHPIAQQTTLALGALATVASIRDAQPDSPATVYPEGNFAEALASLAMLIKAEAGVRVACIDVGGWDTHTGMGNVDSGDMKRHLGDLAEALAAFTTDIGDTHLGRTTIVTMSEFGRRVEENASGGTDHGHGGAVLVIGGGVTGGVHGTWNGLTADVLEQGDVPGWNDYRNVLTEVVTKRLDLTTGSIADVFPGWHAERVGVMAGA
jgi:uncharacterized protein (DUF1501 family)